MVLAPDLSSKLLCSACSRGRRKVVTVATLIVEGETRGGKEGKRDRRTRQVQMTFPARTLVAWSWLAANDGLRLWIYPVTAKEVDQLAVLAITH